MAARPGWGSCAANASTASSARRFGRSIATAEMPRRARPSTCGRIEALVPEAPWPRTSVTADKFTRACGALTTELSQVGAILVPPNPAHGRGLEGSHDRTGLPALCSRRRHRAGCARALVCGLRDHGRDRPTHGVARPCRVIADGHPRATRTEDAPPGTETVTLGDQPDHLRSSISTSVADASRIIRHRGRGRQGRRRAAAAGRPRAAGAATRYLRRPAVDEREEWR